MSYPQEYNNTKMGRAQEQNKTFYTEFTKRWGAGSQEQRAAGRDQTGPLAKFHQLFNFQLFNFQLFISILNYPNI